MKAGQACVAARETQIRKRQPDCQQENPQVPQQSGQRVVCAAADSSFFPRHASGLQLFYGGTFDPVHHGHLAIARAARDALGAPVHLVPAADPPHRAMPGATAEQRRQMLALALAGEQGLRLDLRELQRAALGAQPSYTVETLRELRAVLGSHVSIVWLLGADSFLMLPRWHQWHALFDLAHLVVAERPNAQLSLRPASVLAKAMQRRWSDDPATLAATPAGRVWRLHQPLRVESASAIRRLIAMDDPAWRSLVPATVAAFIEQQSLYGSFCPAR